MQDKRACGQNLRRIAPSWRRALPLTALAILTACGANSVNLSDGAASADGTSSTTPTATTTAPAAPTTTVAPTTTQPSATSAAISGPIVPLTFNEDVKNLQQRLNEMRFFVGEPDGYFGDTTRAQVWAYQKLVLGLRGDAVDGIVTPEIWEHMRNMPQVVDPRPNASPVHVNVFLDSQVLTVFKDGQLHLASHISSGSGEEWCDVPANVPKWPGATTTTNAVGRRQRVCGQSVTPGGVFKVYRRFRGKEEIPLGTVFDPVYFNSGIAIHGFDYVPEFPDSHGCIRVPMHIGTQIHDSLIVDDDVFVFDGVQEPEVYGSQRPPMDELDPTDTQFTKGKPNT